MWYKNVGTSFYHFVIHAFDRHTDGQTDGQTVKKGLGNNVRCITCSRITVKILFVLSSSNSILQFNDKISIHREKKHTLFKFINAHYYSMRDMVQNSHEAYHVGSKTGSF